MHGPCDVLERLLAEVAGRDGQLADHLVEGGGGQHDPARLGQTFEPGGDVDAVAVQVVAIDQHVTEIDADAQADGLLARASGLALDHAALDVHGTGDGLDHARELDQRTVAHELDQTPSMGRQQWVDQLGAMILQPGERRRLGRLHEPAVADDIGRQDSRQPSSGQRCLGQHLPRPSRLLHPRRDGAVCLGQM